MVKCGSWAFQNRGPKRLIPHSGVHICFPIAGPAGSNRCSLLHPKNAAISPSSNTIRQYSEGMVWGQKRKWGKHLALMEELEQAPAPKDGYGPSWEGILAGRREFVGRVFAGPWSGHDVLVLAYGKAPGHRKPRLHDFDFTADYWIVDDEKHGEGAGLPDFSVETIAELYEKLTSAQIDWYPPATSLVRVGLLFGGSGRPSDGILQ